VADESSPIGQDEVEKLLAQSQQGGATPAPSSASDSGAPLAQSDIEALFQQSGETPTAAQNAERSLNRAEEALATVDAPGAELPPGVKPFEFRSLSGRAASSDAATLDLLRDVQLDLKIELGRTHMQLEEVLQLRNGAVVTLDKLAGDPVDIFVNGRLIARGEVLVMNDNFCVRVAELVAGESALA